MTRVDEFVAETLDAITCLAKQDLWMQALVVLYSAIDTLAWSTRKEGDVTKADFCAWVAQYMQPHRFSCTPEDLYGARCALVHSGAAESRLSRSGAATELWYATAAGSAPALQGAIDRDGRKASVVCTTDLVAAFSDGVLQFSDDLAGDEKAQQWAAGRIKVWLTFLPARSVVEAWEARK